ncbi:MAG: hypothetical protein RIC16_05070 [Rhodospirillales bacterium]
MKLYLLALSVVFGLTAALAPVASWAGVAAGDHHMGEMPSGAGHECPMDDCDSDRQHMYRCLMAAGHCEVPQISAGPVDTALPVALLDLRFRRHADGADVAATALDPPPPRV